MRKRESKIALSPDLRARMTAATGTSAAGPRSGQRTAREVDSYSTRLAHLATKQEREEHDLRTSYTRRKARWGLGGYGGLGGAGEVGFEECGPYRSFLPRASVLGR